MARRKCGAGWPPFRQPENETDEIVAGELTFNRCANSVAWGQSATALSARESILLDLFLKNQKRIITHEELQRVAWPENPDVSSGAVRVALTALRERLASVGSPVKILSVRGHGYQIQF